MPGVARRTRHRATDDGCVLRNAVAHPLGRTSSRTRSLRRLRSGLDVGIVQMLRLPTHRFPDAGATRRMIIEDGFLPWARIELSISAELQHCRGERVGFARRVDAEHVRVDLGRS